MKLALLLSGYLESPDYRHLVVIDEVLSATGYTVIRVDPCHLWATGDVNNYTVTNYLHQVREIIDSYLPQNPSEIILIGHSLGSLIAILVANIYSQVTKIVCLSPPNPLKQSDHKWVNGIRTSQKDLPSDQTKFRVFSIPLSFVADRDSYSIVNSLKSLQTPLQIIIGTADPSFSAVSELAKTLNLKNIVTITGMGHDFRQSEELCQMVASEIEKFIQN